MSFDQLLPRHFGAVLILVTGLILTPALAAQRQAQDTALSHPLSLGDAARLASRSSASAQAARYRTEQAGARV